MRLVIASLGVFLLITGAAFWWISGLSTAGSPFDSDVKSPAAVNSENSSTTRLPAEKFTADLPPDALETAPVSSTANTPATMLQPEQSAIAELNEDYPNLDMRLHEMNGRNVGTTYDADAVREVLFETSAWTATDDPGERLELNAEQISDGREFIQFRRLKLDSLVAGDQLEIPIQQTGKTYQAEITQAVVNVDGSVTFNGQLMDELGAVSSESGSPYSVTITSGKDIVSGGIFTPEGHFVLEAVGNQGWIANASTLFTFDESKPDYVIPDNKNN